MNTTQTMCGGKVGQCAKWAIGRCKAPHNTGSRREWNL